MFINIMFINTNSIDSEYINTDNTILIKKITHEEDFILYKEAIKEYEVKTDQHYLLKDTYKYSAIPKGIIFEICKRLKIIKLSCYHWQQI